MLSLELPLELPVSDVWLSLSVRRHTGARTSANGAAIFVGPARQWIPELVERAKNLKISGGFEEGTDLQVILPTRIPGADNVGDPSFHLRQRRGLRPLSHLSRLKVERSCSMDGDVQSPNTPRETLSDLPLWKSRLTWMLTSESPSSSRTRQTC